MPTLNLPVSEMIAVDVFDTVSEVTTQNGFNYTLAVARHMKTGDKRTHLSALIVQDDPHEVTNENYNTREWLLPFSIGVYLIPTDNDATPIDTYVNLVTADVQKALMIDRYRGGNALDTKIKAPHLITEEGSFDLVLIQVEVSYRTAEIDPYLRA